MLAKNIIRQFVAQVIGLISGFVVSIITARILGPEGRGDFSLILNASGFLCLLLGFSFGSSIVHVISTNKMPQRSTVNTFLALVFSLIGLCAIFLLFFPFSKFSFLLPASRNEHALFYPLVLLALFIVSLFTTLFNSVLSGNRLFWQQQKVYLSVTIFSIFAYALLFACRYKFDLDFTAFIIFYIAISVLPAAGAYLMYFKHGRKPFDRSFLDGSQFRYILNFSLLAYLCNVFQFLSYRMDFWIVEYFNGNRDLGLYSLAVNLAQMLWLLPQAISTILLSYSGAETAEKGIQNTNTLSRIAMALILCATIVLLFSIDVIIRLFYGSAFIESAFLFKILLLGIAPFSVTTILASYFAGTGYMRVNLYCSMTGFIVCLILDLILIPKLGITGAAIATVVAYFASTGFIVFVYLKRNKVRLYDFIIIKKEDIGLLKSKLKLKK